MPAIKFEPMSRVPLLAIAFLLATSIGDAEEAPRNESGKIRNVLFIVSDDLRASVLGAYGDSICDTPNLDRLAQRGMVFERAYCQGTVCGPSRISFMYGRHRGRGQVTLAEHFRKQNYYSARVGKIFHMRVPGDIIAGADGQDIPASWTERFNSQGLEAHTPGDYACLNLNIFTTELEGRQSTRMPHRMFVSVAYEGNGSDQPDHKTATKTIELLRKHARQPFFLAAGFIRPHYPMVAPHRYFEKHAWRKMPLPLQRADDLDDIPQAGWAGSRSDKNGIAAYPDNQRRMWSAYAAAVSFMDAQVGRLLDELDRLGLRESTAIIFTSDHGYHLGEHTFWQKSNLHENVIRVPLIISAPGYTAGRCQSIVELVDLFPTLCDLTSMPAPEGLQGASLKPLMTDPSRKVKEGAVSFAKGVSWRTPDWAYMRYPGGGEELYDMRMDPHQFTNLAKRGEYATQRQRLSDALTSRLAELKIAP